MKKLIVAGAALAALFTVSAASAADIPARPYYKAPPPPVFNWSGAYIGAYGGYVDGGYRDEFNDFIDYSGGIAGLYAGYNWQISRNWVIGIEGDFGWAFTDEGNTSFGPGGTAELRWLSSIRGRAGYAVDNWLLFVTGGVAFAEQRFSNLLTPDNVNHTGWIVGVGLDYALSPNWVLRAEYLYYEFDAETYNIGLGPFSANIEPGHIFRIGLAWKR